MVETFKIWNKIDDINGTSASEVMSSQRIGMHDEVFLVMKGERVSEIQLKSIITSAFNLDANLSCEEVAKKYLEIKQQEEQKQKEEIENKLTQQEEIEQLKKQNAEFMYMMMQNQGGTI